MHFLHPLAMLHMPSQNPKDTFTYQENLNRFVLESIFYNLDSIHFLLVDFEASVKENKSQTFT